MRGAPGDGHEPAAAGRIIPADAGSTEDDSNDDDEEEDHPRGCGEHRVVRCLSSASWGSSPRMRGAHVTKISGRVLWRIIPADAGSTSSNPNATTTDKDHPRGCGEHKAGVDEVRIY